MKTPGGNVTISGADCPVAVAAPGDYTQYRGIKRWYMKMLQKIVNFGSAAVDLTPWRSISSRMATWIQK
jgi:hypothetical protein